MSPVDRAASVSEISPRRSFLCKNIDVFIWEAGLARLPRVTEISVFATEISVTGMKIFPYEHSSPVTGTRLFKQNSWNSFALTTERPTKWHSFDLVCISTLEVCELALLVKLQGSRKLWKSRTIRIYVPPFWLCFLNSSRSTGLKFPIWTHHRIRPGNRASPVTGLIWRGLKFHLSYLDHAVQGFDPFQWDMLLLLLKGLCHGSPVHFV